MEEDLKVKATELGKEFEDIEECGFSMMLLW